MIHPIYKSFLLWLLVIVVLSGCNGDAPQEENGKLQVLATTSIVGDVVAQVGGELVQVKVLLPPGTDPHSFQPRPRDAVAIADAQIIFANGAGLEEFLQPLLKSAGASERLVEVSNGIKLMTFEAENSMSGDHHAGVDPHTWMDPKNVSIWVANIATSLCRLDPKNRMEYQSNASAYASSLEDLDAWIREEVAQLAPEKRILVTDHEVFGYFSEEYGFTQVGTITGSFSTNAAPSARELASLEDKILSTGVKAILIGETANQSLAQQVARDTGIQVVTLYHAALTDASGPAPSYLEFMRYNVSAIVSALK